MPYEIHVRTESGKTYPLLDACEKDGTPVQMTAGIACSVIEGVMDKRKADPSVPASKLFSIRDFRLVNVGGSPEVKLFINEDDHVGALYDDGVYVLPGKGLAL